MKEDFYKPAGKGSGHKSSETIFPEDELSAEDQHLVDALRSNLDALDRTVSIPEPDPVAFAAQMKMHHRFIRKQFIRDLLLFLAAVFSILGGMGLMLLKLPMLFMILYAASFLFPIFLIHKERERVREG